ncbi:MAG: hypothetical protein N2510_00220 [Ignavibacteria bacterium]|nr:hypothetical protein [Ignavibacteria bacterium]
MINKDHILYLCISAIGILYLSQLIQKFEYSADDTFIYLQYARNVVSGNGFSFNPGEPSYGVTSPLWVFILTFAYFLNVNPFWFAKSADLLFAVLSCIMFFRLTGFFFRNDIYLRSAAMLMFCLNPWFVRWTFTGMETSLAVFLVISIFYFYYSERFDFMFFLLGLVFLVRPETFVLTIILALFVFFRKISESKFSPREVLLWGILFATSVLPFLIYAKFSFGTIIPNTASGKSTFTFSFNTIVNQLWHILKTLAGASLPELLLSMVFLLFAIQKRNTLKTLSLMFWISGLVFLYVITDADVISRYLLVISPFLIILGLNTVLISGDFRYKLGIIVIICS